MDKKDILKLKKITQARIIDCKQALEESGGDFEKAILWLRKKGQKIAAKRMDKETDKGSIFAKVNTDNSFGIVLSLGCETDFVARNDVFEKLGNTLLTIALQNRCTNLEDLLKAKKDDTTVQEIITQQSATLGENILITQYATLSDTLVSAYIHTGNRIGSLISLNTKPTPIILEVAKNMAMQIVVSDPIAIDEHTLDQSILTREKNIIEEGLKKEGKPQVIAEKIAQGRLNKFIKETTLLAQLFIKDNTQTVEQYLKSINPTLNITGFKRFSITS